MTIPTVAGRDISANIRLNLGDTDASNYEYSDADLTILLGNAMQVYNRLNPYYLETTITTVNGVSDYALPANCVRPIDIPYRVYPGLAPETVVAYLTGLTGVSYLVPFRDWSDETLSKIRQEFALRYESIGAGQAEYTNYLTSYSPLHFLRLYPTPTRDGDTFRVRYSAEHPLQNNDYFTVPPHHIIHIQNLFEAEVLEVRYVKIMSSPVDFTAGSTRIRFGESSRYLQSRAETLRDGVFNALNRPIARKG